VCLRWGPYLAVLADRDRPLWSGTREAGVSRIADDEMAHINIEASAALEQWIGLMRNDRDRYRRLARAALSNLPMTLRTTNITREPPSLFALADPNMAARIVGAQPERAAFSWRGANPQGPRNGNFPPCIATSSSASLFIWPPTMTIGVLVKHVHRGNP